LSHDDLRINLKTISVNVGPGSSFKLALQRFEMSQNDANNASEMLIKQGYNL